MSKDFIEISIDRDEFNEALDDLKKANDNIDDKWLRTTLRRKAKPIEQDMKRNSPSDRLKPMIKRTIAKSKIRGNGVGVRVGVLKNDPEIFPDFSSFGLAGSLEYGTALRYRTNSVGLYSKKGFTGQIKSGSYSFIRPAYDKNEEKVMDEFEKSIEERIMKGIK